MSGDLHAAEKAKRDRMWDPRARWRALQDAIVWAEAQRPVRRNDPAERRREEDRKLGR